MYTAAVLLAYDFRNRVSVMFYLRIPLPIGTHQFSLATADRGVSLLCAQQLVTRVPQTDCFSTICPFLVVCHFDYWQTTAVWLACDMLCYSSFPVKSQWNIDIMPIMALIVTFCEGLHSLSSGRYVYSLSCRELGEKIDTIHVCTIHTKVSTAFS